MSGYSQELEWMANFVYNNLDRGRRLGQKPDDREWKIQRVKTIQAVNELKKKLDLVSSDSNHSEVEGNGSKKLCTGSIADETVNDVDTVNRPVCATAVISGIFSGIGSAVGTVSRSVGFGAPMTEISLAASAYDNSFMSSCFSGISNHASHIKGTTMQWCNQAIGKINSFVNTSDIFINGIPDVVRIVSVQCLNEVEAVLKLDKELSQPLQQWMKFSWELDTNFEAIFGVSLAHPKWRSVTRIFYEFSKLTASEKDFDTILEQRKYSVDIENSIQVESLRKFFQELSVCPQFASRIRTALSVLSQSTEDIWFFRDGVRAYRSFLRIHNSAFVPDLLQDHNAPIRAPNDVLDFGFLKAIDLAIDVISLINAASIIRHGKSKYSDALKSVVSCLAWELTEMENL